jgi:hypothetical protein
MPGQRLGDLYTMLVWQAWWGYPMRKATWLCFGRVDVRRLALPYRQHDSRSNEPMIDSSDCQGLGSPKRATQEPAKPVEKSPGGGIIQGADGRLRTDIPEPQHAWAGGPFSTQKATNSAGRTVVYLRWEPKQKPEMRYFQQQMRPDGSLHIVETDAEGWVKFGGGECPVPASVVVQVRAINSFEVEAPLSALAWNWRNIDAYRVVNATPPMLSAATDDGHEPGIACHTGRHSGFFKVLKDGQWQSVGQAE